MLVILPPLIWSVSQIIYSSVGMLKTLSFICQAFEVVWVFLCFHVFLFEIFYSFFFLPPCTTFAVNNKKSLFSLLVNQSDNACLEWCFFFFLIKSSQIITTHYPLSWLTIRGSRALYPATISVFLYWSFFPSTSHLQQADRERSRDTTFPKEEREKM